MGKTYTDENGYERFKDSDKLVHRWVAEKKLNRPLRKGEVVHHKDRNKRNNSSGNLWVFPNQKAHDKAHNYDAYRFGEHASYKGFKKSQFKSFKKTEGGGCIGMLLFILILIVFTSFIIPHVILSY